MVFVSLGNLETAEGAMNSSCRTCIKNHSASHFISCWMLRLLRLLRGPFKSVEVRCDVLSFRAGSLDGCHTQGGFGTSQKEMNIQQKSLFMKDWVELGGQTPSP